MSAQRSSAYDKQPLKQALQSLAASAASNITGVDFASVSVRRKDQTLDTVAATDELAINARHAPVRAAGGPLLRRRHRRTVCRRQRPGRTRWPVSAFRAASGRSRCPGADRDPARAQRRTSRVEPVRPHSPKRSTTPRCSWPSCSPSQAAVLLGYARQVGSLGEALQSRQDIGTAVGITMQRYGVDRDRAFGFLVRLSQDRNIKLRVIADRSSKARSTRAPATSVNCA